MRGYRSLPNFPYFAQFFVADCKTAKKKSISTWFLLFLLSNSAFILYSITFLCVYFLWLHFCPSKKKAFRKSCFRSQKKSSHTFEPLFNRPCVARAVLQTHFVIHWFVDWLGHWSFMKISSKHLLSQTVRARDLKLWENIHLPLSLVMCQVSHVTYHVSYVNF